MARSSYYRKSDAYRGRRIFLFVTFAAVLALAVYRMGFHVPKPGIRPDALEKMIAPEQAPEQNTPIEHHAPAPAQASAPSGLAVSSSISQGSDDPFVETIAKPVSQGQTLFQQAQQALTQKDYPAAREKLSRVAELQNDPMAPQARKILQDLSDDWLFSKKIFPGDSFCQRYKVVTGDRLAAIAQKFQVPYELLMRINGISNPASLRAGETIKVVQGPFHVEVDRARFLLTVYLADVIVKTYPISIGMEGRETPLGLWRVRLKQKNPAWPDPDTGKYYYPDDPDNPLGERWISLEGIQGDATGRTGFGIHGTIAPDEIGKAASRGCIRLLNQDVEILYDLLVPDQSQARVLDTNL